MNWLEVSLTVNGELAEAVADVLARYAPNGVMTEQGVKFLDDEDEGTATGPVTVRAYLQVNDQLENIRHKLEESLYFLGMIQPLPDPVYRQIADQNWMEAWKQHYKPILIGKRLLVLPAWMESPEPGRIPIRIDPGMAFGTGSHPTTQLCLELMERSFDRGDSTGKRGKASVLGPPSIVIDIGCGSGILSIAALKLGAFKVLGLDTDSESVRNSRENANANEIGEEMLLGQGSVTDVISGKFPIRRAPLVVANILAPIIIRLLDAGLADLIEPGGEIILSGILDHQAGSVTGAAQVQGLIMSDQHQKGDWVALSLKRPDA